MADPAPLTGIFAVTLPAPPALLEAIADLDRAHSPVLRGSERCAQLIDGGGTLLVAAPEERVAGFAALSRVLDEGTLLNIVVAPAERRAGWGAALLAAVIARARELALRRVLLEARVGNGAALALYRAAGFREDGRRPGYYAALGGRGREDAVLMSLDLEEICAHPGNR